MNELKKLEAELKAELAKVKAKFEALVEKLHAHGIHFVHEEQVAVDAEKQAVESLV